MPVEGIIVVGYCVWPLGHCLYSKAIYINAISSRASSSFSRFSHFFMKIGVLIVRCFSKAAIKAVHTSLRSYILCVLLLDSHHNFPSPLVPFLFFFPKSSTLKSFYYNTPQSHFFVLYPDCIRL